MDAEQSREPFRVIVVLGAFHRLERRDEKVVGNHRRIDQGRVHPQQQLLIRRVVGRAAMRRLIYGHMAANPLVDHFHLPQCFARL